MGERLHTVVLRWYCERPKNSLCFDQTEELKNVTMDGLEIARVKLYSMTVYSTCTCGTRIVRSMHVEEN